MLTSPIRTRARSACAATRPPYRTATANNNDLVYLFNLLRSICSSHQGTTKEIIWYGNDATQDHQAPSKPTVPHCDCKQEMI